MHDIDSEEWMHGIFSSYNAALRFASKDYDSKKDETDFTHWYVIHLWRKENDESYKDVCDYYIIDNELCYAEFDFGSEFHESGVNGELNIPVHYKPGDILISDNYPFGPKEKFVMLEIGDNQDCCCLQALSRKQDGTWKVGAVKHGMMGDTIPVFPFVMGTEWTFADPLYGTLQHRQIFVCRKHDGCAAAWCLGIMLLNQFNIFIFAFQGIEELDYSKLTFSRSLSGTNLYNHIILFPYLYFPYRTLYLLPEMEVGYRWG